MSLSRTAHLWLAIARALDEHREQIDRGCRKVVITVPMNSRTGLPRVVVVATESEHGLTGIEPGDAVAEARRLLGQETDERE